MSKRLLFLKLIDLLLFSLLVKTQAGLNEWENKKGFFITSPREYFWIFLLNQKLGIILPLEKQNTLIKMNFWIWQILWEIKRYYKEKQNRFRTPSIKEFFFQPFFWQRSKLEFGDTSTTKRLQFKSFYDHFTQEVNQSGLPQNIINNIFKLRDQTVRNNFFKIQKFMQLDFDKLSFDQILKWYRDVYQEFAQFFTHLYLYVVDIKPEDKKGQESIEFMKQLTIIGAAHDDISDIKGDIDHDGTLREPNLFATLLTKKEKQFIGNKNKGIYSFTSFDEAKEAFPTAYRKYFHYLKNTLHQINLIPGINLHMLLEFYIFHFPAFYMNPISSDSPIKKNFVYQSLNYVGQTQRNIKLINQFKVYIAREKNLDKKKTTKMYRALITYLTAQHLSLSGLPRNEICKYIQQPSSSVSRWINEERLPLSLRLLKQKSQNLNNTHLYFLLGIFSFSGTLTSSYLQLSSQNLHILKKVNLFLNKDKNVIRCLKKQPYIRCYDTQLSHSLNELKINITQTLENASELEVKQFIAGLEAVRGTYINSVFQLSLPVQKNRLFISWLFTYYKKKSILIKISKKNHYYIIKKINGKNLLVEKQRVNPLDALLSGDESAKNQAIEQFTVLVRQVILRYFGSQKHEFWSEIPSLSYLCLNQTVQNFRIKNPSDENRKSFLTYQILDYFKKYFKTNTSLSPTSYIDEVFEEKEGVDEVFGVSGDLEKIKQALKHLKEVDNRLYLTVALRFGLYDGKEHSLTDDLPKRLFELGVTGPNNQILSKSQTYQLLQKSIRYVKSYL